jgi:hypothetical protein
MTADINRPEIVAEVRAAFDRYNAAIDGRDVATLNELFWKSDATVRFGFTENLFGHDAIVAFRGTKWSNAPERRATHVVITAVGRDCATTSAVMERGESVTRQSQTWARFPEGWRIVAAHVSALKK